jgi:PAS domain S-box-containing protein
LILQNSMTVKGRLRVLIGTAVAGVLVLLALLVRDVSTVYRAANFANVNTVPSLQRLGAADREIADLRVLTWQHLANSDPAAVARIEANIASTHGALLKSLNDYQASLVADEQDGDDLKADRAALAEYDALREKVLQLSRTGKKDEARDLLLSSQPILTKVVTAIDTHLTYNSNLGKAGSTQAEATRRESLIQSATIGLVLLGALLLIGRKTIHWLLRTLGGEPGEVAAVARAVAGGNLSSQVTLQPGDTTSLFATVAQMQGDLQVRIENERAAAAENDSVLLAIGKAMATAEFNLDGTLLTANDNFLQVVGYALQEIKGRHHSMFLGSAQSSGQNAETFWNKLVAGEHDAGQYRRIGNGGREIWLQASYNPIFDAAGKPFKIVQFATDITEQVRTTEEVRILAQSAAQGDLTRRIATQGKTGNLLALSQAINSMADGMANIVAQIRTAVEAVRCGTEEISRGNTDLSQRTEQQASSLEETASSMEEMTSTVKQNADNAAQANQLAAAARAQAEKGGEVVSEAVAAMAGINEASNRIADIIGVIDEIAFQTNLLALNAAVEAARAGEQGRGFAVVAAEVRTLASRSAEAAKEIKGLIEDSVSRVEHGSKLVGQSGQSLSDIVTAVKKATDIVAEIAAACQEQASGIDQVNKAVTSLDQVTQQNAALVEEAASAAESLSEEAQMLGRLMANYQIAGHGSGAAGTAAATSMAGSGSSWGAAAGQAARASGAAAKAASGERRKASRPWSQKAREVQVGAAAAAAKTSSVAAVGKASGSDSEWSEF